MLVLTATALAADITPLEPALRDRCLSVLRAGLRSDEFWPAMHAAEALSLAGQGTEVLAELPRRTPADDQQRCGPLPQLRREGLSRRYDRDDSQNEPQHVQAPGEFKLAVIVACAGGAMRVSHGCVNAKREGA